MENKKIDLTPYFDLYEKQNGKPMPFQARRFLTEFSKQVAAFQNWGVWDRRSGFDPLGYEMTLSHVERYLTGPRTLYKGTLPAFSEHLAHALTGFYLCGYEAVDAQSEKENEVACLEPVETM